MNSKVKPTTIAKVFHNLSITDWLLVLLAIAIIIINFVLAIYDMHYNLVQPFEPIV